MNILLVGNGFDLAHGLPTRYTNFLSFLRAIQISHDYMEPIDTDKLRETGIHDGIRTLLENQTASHNGNVDEVFELMKENVWVEYFLKVYNTLPKDGWIDFEHEISTIVQNLDKLQSDYTRVEKKELIRELKILPTILSRYHLYDPAPMKFDFPKMVERLLNDLDQLIRCLEIYLCYCLDLIQQTEHLHVISDIGTIDGVLSFNYTDTFERIYAPRLVKEPAYCYIHGKARAENNILLDNIVLGIDEYLSDSDRNNKVQFVRFKKYYQRIFKQTDYNYTEWFSQPGPKNLYIVGHSLDVTDKDVLRDIITKGEVKTTIFYHNKQANAEQIINLVKVLGYDTLNTLARGADKDRSIVFSQLL